ncbi:hypothetical protein K461DRAFT_298401 [Myriangium duriaei CBS 260.36]|uniref:Protein kinase domain-containing protein n=1 Tax=Myriangium duriaei CBS 260.36 TaxID=1168546 RepID=A0A9P4ISN3_9PEZI|nr:hypothetical protein K461DRAFT_298401 [Myriangium duriaei CBS 260.36]
MSSPSVVLLSPYRALSTDGLIAIGSSGIVYWINKRVVFKSIIKFRGNDIPPSSRAHLKESIAGYENEKAIYEMLSTHRHPNILHSILAVPEGQILLRIDTTLRHVLDGGVAPIPGVIEEQWILQLAEAVAWLEKLSYVHGDLHAANVFLDSFNNVQLADFDRTVKTGQPLLCGCLGFDSDMNRAGAESEQSALTNCIYYIRFRQEPYAHLKGPEQVKKLRAKDFPHTASDQVFGKLINDCWWNQFPSMAAVLGGIRECLSQRDSLPPTDQTETCSNVVFCSSLLDECNEWLLTNQKDKEWV